MARPWILQGASGWGLALALLFCCIFTPGAAAQTLEERLDEDAFLRGLIDQGLPEVLEHYMQMNPPDDPVRAAQFQIAAQQLRVREASSPVQRLQEVQQLIALRDAMLEAHPDHPRRALWLADEAADLFFQLLPTEASGITCLFGLPTESQRARGRLVAERMQNLTAMADLELHRTLMNIEAQPDFERDESLQMQRRRIVRDERERRIPFLRGVAAVLGAELLEQDPEQRTALMEEAAALLTPLCAQLEGVVGARACLYAGLANLAAGAHEQAASAFLDAAKSESSAADAFAARLGQIRVVEAQAGEEAALVELEELAAQSGGDADLFQRILIADQRFLLQRRLAMNLDGGDRREALKETFSTYLDLLEERFDAEGALSDIVFDKLAMAVQEDMPLDDLPAIVTVARGRHLSDDPQRCDEAMALLEPVLDSDELDERTRAVALFALGRALYLAGREQEAAERFFQVATEHPTAAEAERSIELAATIARQVSEKQPDSAQAVRFFREIVDELVERFPNLPTIDQWRYAAGRLAMDSSDHGAAAEMFRRIGRDSPQWPDAQFMLVSTLSTRAAASSDEHERRQLHEEVLAAGQHTAAALERAVAEGGSDRLGDLRYYLSFTRVLQAKALVELERSREALEVLETVNRREELEPSVLAALLRTRIAAHRAMGEPGAAQSELSQFMETSPEEAAVILSAMLRTSLAEIAGLVESGRADAARQRAAEDAAPLADLAAGALPEEIDEQARRTLLQFAADSYRHAGRYGEALGLYERLLRDDANAIELVFGRAESLYGLGEAEELATAMGLFKQIAAGGRSLGEHYYWQSQLRMLQILDIVQRNTEKIALRIRRLQQLEDPDLGGPRYRQQFDQLYSKYAGK